MRELTEEGVADEGVGEVASAGVGWGGVDERGGGRVVEVGEGGGGGAEELGKDTEVEGFAEEGGVAEGVAGLGGKSVDAAQEQVAQGGREGGADSFRIDLILGGEGSRDFAEEEGVAISAAARGGDDAVRRAAGEVVAEVGADVVEAKAATPPSAATRRSAV